MKKTAIVLLLTILISFIPMTGIADITLSDISGHWAKSDIEYLVDKGVVDGYPDGTFRPDNTLQIDHFIKLIVTSIGFKNLPDEGGYWATKYINKAVEIGLITENEITDYTLPITRKLMSKIVVRGHEFNLNNEIHHTCTDPECECYGGSENPENCICENCQYEIFTSEESMFDTSDVYLYRSTFLDYLIFTPDYADYIALANKIGIIGGYPDGTFKQDNNATRAEACTMVCRLIDESRRLTTEPPVLSEFMEKYNKGGSDFDEYIDNSGEYLYTNARFYRLENGKYLVEENSNDNTLYVDGLEPDDTHFNNLSEITYDVSRALYGENFYVGVEYRNAGDYEEELSNVVIVRVSEKEIQYFARNYSFSYFFYITEPPFDKNLFMVVEIEKLYPETDPETGEDFNRVVNGYTYHEYEYRMIASMVKIFGDEYGYDIGEYLVSEYARKNPELLTHGYIDTRTYGNIKVESTIPNHAYTSTFYFYYTD
jgi:hypothetical protein